MNRNLPTLAVKFALMLALTGALVGCGGEVTVDTGSANALNSSVSDMSAELQPVERQRFKAAIQTLIKANRVEGRSLDEIAASLAPQIGGKTAAEVIAGADAWSAAEEKRLAALKRKQRLAELEKNIIEYTTEMAKLETVIVENAATTANVLGQFTVSGERYFWRDTQVDPYPILDVTIANNHGRAIETVTVKGVLRTAGGSGRLVEGQLRYEFPGRLKPGETKRVRFEPDVFGDWARAALKDREDLELKMEIVNLTYSDGSELIRTYIFRGDDPIVRVEGLKRRLEQARTERSAMVEGTGAAGS